MKKIFLLLLMIICKSGLSLFSQASVTVPEEGKYYTIQQSTAASGLYITRAVERDNPIITLLSGNADQVFAFEPVAGADEGTYYIKNMLSEEYLVLGTANVWTMVWVTDPTAIPNLANGEYQILPIAGNTDYVQIKNLGSNLLGTDVPLDSVFVYGDKNATSNPDRQQWKIKEYSNVVDKAALQSKVDEAIAFFDATVQGNLPDQYPSVPRNTLDEQINYALDVLDNVTASQALVNATLQALSQALQDYKDNVNPLQPDPDATFYIIHSSGLYLGDGPVIANADYSADQQFKFVPVPGQPTVFNIEVLSTGLFITRGSSDGWSLMMANDPTTNAAQFQIKSVGGGYYRINCMLTTSGTGGNVRTTYTMGTDYPANATSFGVFIDKTGADVRDHWIIQNINVQGVVKTSLQAAVDKVNDFLKYTSGGSGSDQIPTDEYAALMEALNAAEAVLVDTNATQSDVSDATTALNSAFAAALAAINPYQPNTAIPYNIVHSGGLFFGEYSDTTVVNGVGIFSQTGDNDQEFQFVAVPDSTGVYNIKSVALGQFLTRSVAPHIDSNTGEQQIDGSGNAMFDDYALVWGDDPTTALAQFVIKKAGVQNYYTIKCDTIGPYRKGAYMGVDNDSVQFSGVYIDKDGTSVLHYWNIVEASTVISIKPVNVNTAIAYGADRLLTVGNLTGSNRIFIYSTTGQLTASAEISESEYSKALPAGSYIVVVKGNSSYRGVVIVK